MSFSWSDIQDTVSKMEGSVKNFYVQSAIINDNNRVSYDEIDRLPIIYTDSWINLVDMQAQVNRTISSLDQFMEKKESLLIEATEDNNEIKKSLMQTIDQNQDLLNAEERETEFETASVLNETFSTSSKMQKQMKALFASLTKKCHDLQGVMNKLNKKIVTLEEDKYNLERSLLLDKQARSKDQVIMHDYLLSLKNKEIEFNILKIKSEEISLENSKLKSQMFSNNIQKESDQRELKYLKEQIEHNKKDAEKSSATLLRQLKEGKDNNNSALETIFQEKEKLKEEVQILKKEISKNENDKKFSKSQVSSQSHLASLLVKLTITQEKNFNLVKGVANLHSSVIVLKDNLNAMRKNQLKNTDLINNDISQIKVAITNAIKKETRENEILKTKHLKENQSLQNLLVSKPNSPSTLITSPKTVGRKNIVKLGDNPPLSPSNSFKSRKSIFESDQITSPTSASETEEDIAFYQMKNKLISEARNKSQINLNLNSEKDETKKDAPVAITAKANFESNITISKASLPPNQGEMEKNNKDAKKAFENNNNNSTSTTNNNDNNISNYNATNNDNGYIDNSNSSNNSVVLPSNTIKNVNQNSNAIKINSLIINNTDNNISNKSNIISDKNNAIADNNDRADNVKNPKDHVDVLFDCKNEKDYEIMMLDKLEGNKVKQLNSDFYVTIEGSGNCKEMSTLSYRMPSQIKRKNLFASTPLHIHFKKLVRESYLDIRTAAIKKWKLVIAALKFRFYEKVLNASEIQIDRKNVLIAKVSTSSTSAENTENYYVILENLVCLSNQRRINNRPVSLSNLENEGEQISSNLLISLLSILNSAEKKENQMLEQLMSDAPIGRSQRNSRNSRRPRPLTSRAINPKPPLTARPPSSNRKKNFEEFHYDYRNALDGSRDFKSQNNSFMKINKSLMREKILRPSTARV